MLVVLCYSVVFVVCNSFVLVNWLTGPLERVHTTQNMSLSRGGETINPVNVHVGQ